MNTDLILSNLLNPPVLFFFLGKAAHNENYATLLAFSLGRLDNQTVMKKLGIDSEKDLFLLMVQAHLPMPHLPEAETRKMVDALYQLPR